MDLDIETILKNLQESAETTALSSKEIKEEVADFKEKLPALTKRIATVENLLQSEFLEKVKEVKLDLSETDRETLQTAEKHVKRFNFVLYFLGGITLFSLLAGALGVYLARDFYRSSVLSREEIRGEILGEIKDEGMKIYPVEEWSALNNEKFILSEWIKNNPTDSKAYLNFRSGILKGAKNYKVFSTPVSEKIITAGE